MMNVGMIKESVHGVQGAFFLRDKKVKIADIDVKYISKSISYLIDVVKKNNGDLKKISILGENKDLRVYIHKEFVLGVLTSDKTNVPLLDLVSNKVLQTLDGTEVVFREESLGKIIENILSSALGHVVARDIISSQCKQMSITQDEITVIHLDELSGKTEKKFWKSILKPNL